MRAVTLAMAVVIVLLGVATRGEAQGADQAERERQRRDGIRALRDRPFGSTGTGSIMGSSGIDSAFGTPGSITSGVGRGTGVQAGGPDSSALPASRNSPNRGIRATEP